MLNSRISKFSSDYIFFSFTRVVTLGLLPLFAVLYLNKMSFYHARIFNSEDAISMIRTYEFVKIDNGINTIMLINLILLTVNICFRWGTLVNDGSYGYWLLLSVDRKKFIIYSSLKIIIILLIFGFSMVWLTVVTDGVFLDTFTIIKIFFSMVFAISNLVFFAFLITDIMKNPEIASTAYLFIGFLVLLYRDRVKGVILISLLVPSNLWKISGNLFGYMVSAIVSLVLFILMLKFHLTRDIEL